MRYYCTYFDHNYLPRGLALYDSLRRYGGDFQLWVLCLSDECEQSLQKLKLQGLEAISLREFEAGDIPLQAAKKKRSPIEYFFTCTPSLPLFLFKKIPAMDAVTYLDGDLYFFGDAEEVHAEIGDASIAITPHRFPPTLRHGERYGIYNVGWLTFRRDANAFACLEWWRERCLEWCYDREEKGRFADQKYLDDWPTRFTGVKAIEHPGVNLAPWNLVGHQLDWDRGRVWVDGRPLLVFHFHGLKQLTRHIFDPQLKRYQIHPEVVLKRRIYGPYLDHLISLTDRLKIKKTSAGTYVRFADQTPLGSNPTWREALRKRRQFSQHVLNDSYLQRESLPAKRQPIGVVLPIFRAGNALKKHLDAIDDWIDLVQEIVVVAGSAEKDSLKLIRERLNRPGLRMLSHVGELRGAWNFGSSQITSKYTYVSTGGDSITREGLQHLARTAERLECDLVLSVPRAIDADRKSLTSIRWPIHHLVANLHMSAPCILSKSCAFSLAASAALQPGLPAASGSNLYRTEILRSFPFPPDCGNAGDIAWKVRHAFDIVVAGTPACFSEILFHEEVFPPEAHDRLAREVRSTLNRVGEAGHDEARMLFEWLNASEDFSRARGTLEKYRRLRLPWFLFPGAWHVRAQQKRARKRVEALRHQIESLRIAFK